MNLPHPSELLSKEWTSIIREASSQSEIERKLPKAQLDLIFNQGWFKLRVPASYGGGQKPVDEAIQFIEALAWADGSLGWNVALGAMAAFQSAFVNRDTSKMTLTGGDFYPTFCRTASGTAEPTENGYVINGKWDYISGSAEANFIVINCIENKDGHPVSNEDGNLRILSFVLLKSEISVVPGWKSLGMLGTTGDSIVATNLSVDKERMFVMGEGRMENNSLYSFPFLQLCEACLAAVVSGLTLHYLDLANAYFSSRNTPDGVLLAEDRVVQGELGRLTRKFDAAREKLFYSVSILWMACAEHKPLYPSLLNKVSAATAVLAQVSRETVNDLYPFCGISVTEQDSEFNRVWRDFQTCGQHSLLVFGGITSLYYR